MLREIVDIKRIPVINWSLVQEDECDSLSLEVNKLPETAIVEATDDTGDLICSCDGGLYYIDHEVNTFSRQNFICHIDEDLDRFLSALIELPEPSKSATKKELKNYRKQLKEIRKSNSIKFFNEDLDMAINDVKELLDDFDFISSPKGQIFDATCAFRAEFQRRCGYPERYVSVSVENILGTNKIKLIGWCTKEDETIEELSSVFLAIETELIKEVGNLKSFNDYLDYLHKSKGNESGS